MIRLAKLPKAHAGATFILASTCTSPKLTVAAGACPVTKFERAFGVAATAAGPTTKQPCLISSLTGTTTASLATECGFCRSAPLTGSGVFGASAGSAKSGSPSDAFGRVHFAL